MAGTRRRPAYSSAHGEVSRVCEVYNSKRQTGHHCGTPQHDEGEALRNRNRQHWISPEQNGEPVVGEPFRSWMLQSNAVKDCEPEMKAAVCS